MVAKDIKGNMSCYPCVETVQKDNICHLVIAPAQIDGQLCHDAQQLSLKVLSLFEGAGVFGVELFLDQSNNILVNEVAPRPHNSGHYTIEACETSQYEQHLRCVTGLSMGSTKMKVNASIMLNIIGVGSGTESFNQTMIPAIDSLIIEGATGINLFNSKVHLYGKKECRLGRKMGHITLVGTNMSRLFESVGKLGACHSDITLFPLVGVIMGSDSDLPVVKPALILLKQFKVPFEGIYLF
jgi:phosphoribosylaminoimidazole carboxylase